MPGVRKQYDADIARTNEPTSYRTEDNVHELDCGVCGRLMYVDKQTFEDFKRKFQHDPDNQFVCMDCDRDYEERAYE